MRLSAHFTLDEMLKSQTALRMGLSNDPGPDQLEALVDLCELMLELYYWIAENLDFDQLILEYYSGEPSSGWVHVSYVGSENRGQTLRIDKSGVTRETVPKTKAA